MKIKSKDVAKALQISEATVSLVLNEKPGVSSKTRNKVLDYIRKKEEETYQKRISKYNSNRKGGLILMLQYIKHGIIFDRMQEDYQPYIRTVRQMVEKEGYAFEYFRYDERFHDLDKLIEGWKNRNIQGIYLMGAEMDKHDILYFSKMKVPIVVGDNNFYDLGIDSYLIDNEEGMRRCVDYLVDCGHSQIMYLAESIDIFNFTERRNSFKQEMSRKNCGNAENRILQMGKNYEEIYYNTLEMLSKGNYRATAFILESSLISLGVIQALQEYHVKIPKNISLIGFDAIPPVNLSALKLTTVKGTHTMRHMAAIKHLMRHIADNETEIIRVYYRTKMQPGNSVFDKTKYIYI